MRSGGHNTQAPSSKRLALAFAVVAGLVLGVSPVEAQILGRNTPEDFGLQSGSLAPPGVYMVAALYVRYGNVFTITAAFLIPSMSLE